MKTDEPFTIYARVETTGGYRYLIYDTYQTDRGSASGSTLRFGLGTGISDGKWHTITRNLYDDLATFQPNNSIIAVHGMLIRGSARLDDIEMITIVDAPPIATLTVSPLLGVGRLVTTLDATNSTDDKGIVQYSFDFGDGNSTSGGSEASVPHVYTTPGVYTASVTVTDTSGQVSSAEVILEVQVDTVAPITHLVASSTIGHAPFTTSFDASASSDNVGIVHYSWIFGDDTAELEGPELSIVNHTYITPGSYAATVTVSDQAGNSAVSSADIVVELEVPVDQPPVASFTYELAALGSTVSFNDASTDDLEISSFAWDFGDATDLGQSTNQSPSYTYSSIGDFAVTLTVTDSADQQDTVTQVVTITDVDNEPLVAMAFVSASVGEAPLTVTLNATESSGGQGDLIYRWTLDRGDIQLTGEGAQYTVQLSEPGEYLVTLEVQDETGTKAQTTLTVEVREPDVPPNSGVSSEAAARLLAQASFGATMESITQVQALGIEGWIDDQFTLQGPPHLDFVLEHSNNSRQEPRHEIWWRDVVDGEDQLRQRVAFALSQIFVISDQGYTLGNAQYGVTHYYDQLRENAFGNYRELLEIVTLSPVMGVYLSMLQNEKGDEAGNTRADENFAREVLQLFSVGLHQLNLDGTEKVHNNQPIPAFLQEHVEAYARVFTGWNFGGASSWTIASINSRANKQVPMESWPQYHDTGEKVLLGGITSPAGLSAEADLELALDSIANHSNVGPFIVRQLIQKLVSSNPTPGYVARVAAVFNDNGNGVRGDLRAVVKALLLDSEARSGHESVPDFGKLREPVLRLSHLWRAFRITPGTLSTDGVYNTRSPHVKDLNYLSGQAVLKSPSVFNFFHPGYAPLGPIYASGKLAPEAEIYTDNTITAMTTRVNTHIQYVHDASDANAKKSAYINLSLERTLAQQGNDQLLDHLNLLMLSGGMSDGLRNILTQHLQSLPSSDTESGQSKRVRDALSLIMASPEYLVQM